MVMVVWGGASPKNSGSVVVITSPSLILCKVTVWEEGVAISSGTSNPEVCVVSWGTPSDALGVSEIELGGRFLKSCGCPRIMFGVGFADWGNTLAVATPSGPAWTEISRRVEASSIIILWERS